MGGDNVFIVLLKIVLTPSFGLQIMSIIKIVGVYYYYTTSFKCFNCYLFRCIAEVTYDNAIKKLITNLLPLIKSVLCLVEFIAYFAETCPDCLNCSQKHINFMKCLLIILARGRAETFLLNFLNGYPCRNTFVALNSTTTFPRTIKLVYKVIAARY